jgi:hypothetical protein
MDADTALAEIRALVSSIRAHNRMTTEQVERLAELIEGMDDGLTNDTFALPADWQGQHVDNAVH